MTRKEATNKTIDILFSLFGEETLPVKREDVTDKSTLMGDIQLDSLDVVEFIMRIEREFQVKIDENLSINTIEELVTEILGYDKISLIYSIKKELFNFKKESCAFTRMSELGTDGKETKFWWTNATGESIIKSVELEKSYQKYLSDKNEQNA